VQESWQTEFWIQRYGSGSFEGQNGLFRRYWGVFVEFLVAEGLSRERTGLLRSLGNFQGILVDL
jgi:hypothetical protein